MRHRRSRPVLLTGLLVGVLLLLGQASAFAQTGYPPGPGPIPGPDVVVFTQVLPSAVSAAPAPVQQSQPLPRTGGDIVRWAVLGLALLGVGSALFSAGYRRSHSRA